MIQIDDSDHRWFEKRGDACTLLVFIDDATSRLVRLRFVVSKSTDRYLSAVHDYVVDLGRPVAFYSDKHPVFQINRSNAAGGIGTPTSEDFGGKYFDVYDFPDIRFEARSKGLLLPYSIFSKDQRVSHSAIVEDKRLGHALALIRAK